MPFDLSFLIIGFLIGLLIVALSIVGLFNSLFVKDKKKYSANQEHDSKEHTTKNKKEQSSEPVQFILGCLTMGGLLFAFYYVVFKIAESDKL